jgi:hypothetical protein
VPEKDAQGDAEEQEKNVTNDAEASSINEEKLSERDADSHPESVVDAEEALDADGAAKRVAIALGVEGEGEGTEGKAEETEAKEPDVVPNRASRRRDDAVERRRKRKGTSTKTAESAIEPLPKDKNARAKELLKRRREQASGPQPINLLPGEMVEDALARSTSAVAKWFRTNFGSIQWVLIAGLVGVGGFLLYTSLTEKKSAAAADALEDGVTAERGRVMA